jgi:carbon storage regulator
MLVLSRKKNERIVIGKDVLVSVVEIRGDKVRLGIEAPREVRVDRQEVADAIAREIAAGTPLHVIEDRLDLQENIERKEEPS